MAALYSILWLAFTCAGIYAIGKHVYEGIQHGAHWAVDKVFDYFDRRRP